VYQSQEMKRISVIALSLSLWGWGYGVAIAAQPSLGSSFREWCLQRGSLSASLRKTVEVLSFPITIKFI
jgi:internalin A